MISKKLSDSEKIFEELDNLPEETKSKNFEEFWIGRVGKLYMKDLINFIT